MRRTFAFVLWLQLVVLYAVLIIHHVLTGPRDGDAYAYTIGFQVFAFAFFRLPPLLLFIAGVLLIDRVAEWAAQYESKVVLSCAIAIGFLLSLALGVMRINAGMAEPTLNPYDQSFEFQFLRFLRTVQPLLAIALVGFIGVIGWAGRQRRAETGDEVQHAS